MNDERIKFSGRLAQEEMTRQQLELKIKGLVDSIRDCLDPFAGIDDLRTDEAAQQAFELAECRIQWIEACGRIKALKKALGR